MVVRSQQVMVGRVGPQSLVFLVKKASSARHAGTSTNIEDQRCGKLRLRQHNEFDYTNDFRHICDREHLYNTLKSVSGPSMLQILELPRITGFPDIGSPSSWKHVV